MRPSECIHRLQAKNGLLLRRLIPYGAGLVVESEQGFYSLDLKAKRAKKLEDTLGVATFQTKPLTLRREKERYSLWHEQEELPLPKAQLKRSAPLLLGANDSFALLQSGFLSLYRDGTWHSSPWRQEESSLLVKRRFLLSKGVVYIALDRGEWGGGLWAHDITKGETKPTALPFGSRAEPATDIKQNPGGSLWLTRGKSVAHLAKGGLYRSLDGVSWECFLYVSPWDMLSLVARQESEAAESLFEEERQRISQSRTSWGLEPTSLRALSFGQDGAPHVLSVRHGPVRFDGERWTPIFPWWRSTLVVDLFITDKDVVVIATHDSGVLFWDRPNDLLEHIELKGQPSGKDQ